jgi:predicted metal-dependent hydrolase
MEQQVYCVTTTTKVVRTYEVHADSHEEAEKFFEEKSGWLISSFEEEEEIETIEKMIYYLSFSFFDERKRHIVEGESRNECWTKAIDQAEGLYNIVFSEFVSLQEADKLR